MLRDATVKKAGHNLKYDVQVMRRAGIEVGGLAYDSMLASFVADPSRRSHGIDALVLEAFGTLMTQYTDLTGKGKLQIPFAEVSVAAAASYCGADSAMVLALHDWYAPTLDQAALRPLLETLEMPLIPVLVDMEWTGILIDLPRFAELGRILGHDLEVLETQIQAAAGGGCGHERTGQCCRSAPLRRAGRGQATWLHLAALSKNLPVRGNRGSGRQRPRRRVSGAACGFGLGALRALRGQVACPRCAGV